MILSNGTEVQSELLKSLESYDRTTVYASLNDKLPIVLKRPKEMRVLCSTPVD